MIRIHLGNAALDPEKTRGRFVAFLGADGAGKSSVIEGAVRALDGKYSKIRRYHLRPHFGADRSSHPAVEDPHAEPPRTLLGSLLKLTLWFADYLYGYYALVRPAVKRGELVIFDRYYYDLLVDPRRYRYGGPLRLVAWLARYVPRPETILLDAPSEILRRRKQEVSAAETARQRQSYLQLAADLKAEVIDASLPLEQVTSLVTAQLEPPERQT